jgi:hypothetical protein
MANPLNTAASAAARCVGQHIERLKLIPETNTGIYKVLEGASPLYFADRTSLYPGDTFSLVGSSGPGDRGQLVVFNRLYGEHQPGKVVQAPFSSENYGTTMALMARLP